jgi:hypothetical protein
MITKIQPILTQLNSSLRKRNAGEYLEHGLYASYKPLTAVEWGDAKL